MARRTFWAVNGTLLVGVALIAYFGLSSLFHKASAQSAPRTATVTTGRVTQTVTASGNVSPAQSENVNFATGGTVTSINVTLGQHVVAGQTLATLDSGPAQAALTAADDQLTAAQDNLSLAQSGNESPPQVQQDDATVAADQSAVNTAQAALTADQAQLATFRAQCAKGAPAASTSPTTTASGAGSSGSASSTGPCQEATTEQQTVSQAQSSLTQTQNALTQENLSIAAKRYVSPSTILQDQAQVTSAQETVTQDQKTLSGTTLIAPFDGTVTALGGTVGQTVSGGGNAASSAATGSSASSGTGGNGTGSGAASGAAGTGSSSTSNASSSTSNASSSSSTSSSSSSFLTLSDLSNLDVVAGFPEASAVKIKVGQPATVTMSATSTTANGSVTAISPVPTVVSNVVTYSVTISLQNPPATVQNGMSANVAVTVASASNALELPSSAITTTGRASTVELLKNGKQVLTPISPGLVGDSSTQILSGLSAGDQVVEPSVTVSGSGTGTGTGTGTGFGGGGFGGLGGGGFGGLGGGGGGTARAG